MNDKKLKVILILAVVAVVSAMVSISSIPTARSEEPAENDAWYPFLNPERDYLVVVNAENPYAFDSEYDVALQKDLVKTVDPVVGELNRVEKATYVAFCLLRDSLTAKGMDVGIYSAQRNEQEQDEVYAYYSNLKGWAETNTVLPSGLSEHHTGLLLNVVIKYSEDGEDPIWYTETAERQQTIPYFKLLHETLADFGFIDRYPAGKEAITGSKCEPYEIRFVGSSKIAHAIMDNNLCLEEYLRDPAKYE